LRLKTISSRERALEICGSFRLSGGWLFAGIRNTFAQEESAVYIDWRARDSFAGILKPKKNPLVPSDQRVRD
jgi:hypothetical protein